MTTDSKEFTIEIYNRLIAAVKALPPNAIERTKGNETGKQYDTAGYGYQWLMNVMNDVIGPSGWSMEYRLVKEITGQTKSGRTMFDLTMDVEIDILGTKRKCAGGHQSMTYADAYKGAITNGFKKTVAMFGIGKETYEGTLDDDNHPSGDEVGFVSNRFKASPGPGVKVNTI